MLAYPLFLGLVALGFFLPYALLSVILQSHRSAFLHHLSRLLGSIGLCCFFTFCASVVLPWEWFEWLNQLIQQVPVIRWFIPGIFSLCCCWHEHQKHQGRQRAKALYQREIGASPVPQRSKQSNVPREQAKTSSQSRRKSSSSPFRPIKRRSAKLQKNKPPGSIRRLEKKLFGLTHDRETAHRLVDAIQSANPGRERKWVLSKAISDLERDRQA